MCLNKIDFNLRWNKKEYTAFGYKSVNARIDSINRVLISPYKKTWMQATGYYNKKINKKNRLESHVIISEDLTWYHPGFHIFLDKEAALEYSNNSNRAIIEVEFKNILAFGNNITYQDNKYYPCIIAEYMRVVNILEFNSQIVKKGKICV